MICERVGKKEKRDGREWRREKFKFNIGLVLTDIFFFSMSLKRYWRREKSDQRLIMMILRLVPTLPPSAPFSLFLLLVHAVTAAGAAFTT